MIVKIDRVVLDAVTWTPITAGIDCDAVILANILGVALKLRTTSTDPNSEKSIQSLQEFPITNEKVKNQKIRASEVLIYGQLASGSGSIEKRLHTSGVAS